MRQLAYVVSATMLITSLDCLLKHSIKHIFPKLWFLSFRRNICNRRTEVSSVGDDQMLFFTGKLFLWVLPISSHLPWRQQSSIWRQCWLGQQRWVTNTVFTGTREVKLFEVERDSAVNSLCIPYYRNTYKPYSWRLGQEKKLSNI